jgi:hypothetical protein
LKRAAELAIYRFAILPALRGRFVLFLACLFDAISGMFVPSKFTAEGSLLVLAAGDANTEPVCGSQCVRNPSSVSAAIRKCDRGLRRFAWLIAVLPVVLTGCKMINPSNYRSWAPDQKELAWAEFNGDQVTVHNIRNCKYVTADDYILTQYDKTFDLNEISHVEFIMVPFSAMPSIAHTMVSFAFDTGDHVVVSVEIRKEEGESYSPFMGVARQYEIQYVVADERDAIQLSAVYQNEDVYMCRAKADRQQVRALFVDMMQRANKLVEEPEFYNTLTNNCTTNIRDHVNNISPGRIPWNIGVQLPGLSYRHAYDLGLFDTDLPFEEMKQRANVSMKARQFKDSPDFSQKIRL